MFIAAGRVIEKVSGKPWGEFRHRNAFSTPLGMTRTTTSDQRSKGQLRDAA